MSLTELLPTVQKLSRIDKLRLIEWLAAQVAKEENLPTLPSEVEYTVWSPHEAYEAASTLAAFLDHEKANR